MPRPLVVTVESVRDLLIGDTLGEYLSLLGQPAQVDARIRTLIIAAQADVERDCQTFLTQRVIKSRPASANPDGSPAVKGTDYDLEEDAYTWFEEDWKGFAQFVTKRRPVQSVQDVRFAYGQSQPVSIMTVPEAWQVANHLAGIINIQPVIGVGLAQSAGMALMPLVSGNLMTLKQPIACIVHMDYTAGFLPANFNPYTDDPWDANPDQDVAPLLQAVSCRAAAKLLLRAAVANDSDAGSLNVDGASESVPPGRLDKVRENLLKEAQDAIDGFNATDVSGFCGILG